MTGLDLADCQQLGGTLYGPWKAHDWSGPKTPKQFSKDRFIWHAERDSYECPAGQMLKRVSSHTRVCSGGREVMEWTYRGDAETCQACPLRAQCTTSQQQGRSVQRSEHDDLLAAHRAWMETVPAKSVYRLWGQTVEIVFADVKEHRGLRRFSGHGFARVQAEFALDVLLHNLLAVHGALRDRADVEPINDATEDIAT